MLGGIDDWNARVMALEMECRRGDGAVQILQRGQTAGGLFVASPTDTSERRFKARPAAVGTDALAEGATGFTLGLCR